MRSHLTRITAACAALCLSASLYAGTAAEDVQVEEAYARAVPPGQSNSAAFMSLTNKSDADHGLVAAESGASKVTELHTHFLEDGMMKMRPVAKIDLPAGETVKLQPGGLHLMLIDLARQLSPAEEVSITLVFEDGSRTSLTVPVQTVQQTMSEKRISPVPGSSRSCTPSPSATS
jgi:copper(I)-binding protein